MTKVNQSLSSILSDPDGYIENHKASQIPAEYLQIIKTRPIGLSNEDDKRMEDSWELNGDWQALVELIVDSDIKINTDLAFGEIKNFTITAK